MDRKRRTVLAGLRVANVTFFGVAITLFFIAAVGVVRPHKSRPRTAFGAANVAPGDRSPSSVDTPSTTTRVQTVAPPSPSDQPAANPPRQCHTTDLAITDNGGHGAGGVFYGTMVVRNTGSQPCTLYGYPGLQRRDARGQVLRTTVLRERHPTTALVTLAPQQQASFGYSSADVPSDGSTRCDHATTVDVIPPDETTQVNLPSQLVACRPAEIVTVGPIEPGTAATLAGLS